MRITFGRIIPIVFATLVSLGLSSPVHADAAPGPAQYVTPGWNGQTMWVIGGNSNCRGPVRVDLQTDPRKRGVVYATYRPGRFVGDGPGWKRNPVCTFRSWSTLNYGEAYAFWDRKRVSPVIKAGPRGGKPVKQTLRPGSGLQYLLFGVPGIHQGAGFYILVP